jgi:hypothetical protein
VPATVRWYGYWRGDRAYANNGWSRSIREENMIAALLVLAAVLGSLTLPTAPVIRAAAPPAQVDQDEIREVVRRANSDAVYSEAYRQSNPDLLRSTWGGEALLDMQDDIEGLRSMNQYLDLQLENLDFERIDELGPGRVRVVTVERWLARLYQTGGTYVGQQRQTVENRYLLDHRDGAWYIIEVDQEIRPTEQLPSARVA